jgi:hypothetical protein
MSNDSTSKQVLVQKYKELMDAARLKRDDAKIQLNAARREDEQCYSENVDNKMSRLFRIKSLAERLEWAEQDLQRRTLEYNEACALK